MADVLALIITCLILVGLLVLVLKIIVACHRFITSLRGNPDSAPGRLQRPQPPSSGVISYRTRNGRSDYKFRIEKVGGDGYRVYILDHPSYGSRNTSAHATHRFSSSQGHYICWNSKLKSVEEARGVAAAWADKTEDYILSGTRF